MKADRTTSPVALSTARTKPRHGIVHAKNSPLAVEGLRNLHSLNSCLRVHLFSRRDGFRRGGFGCGGVRRALGHGGRRAADRRSPGHPHIDVGGACRFAGRPGSRRPHPTWAVASCRAAEPHGNAAPEGDLDPLLPADPRPPPTSSRSGFGAGPITRAIWSACSAEPGPAPADSSTPDRRDRIQVASTSTAGKTGAVGRLPAATLRRPWPRRTGGRSFTRISSRMPCGKSASTDRRDRREAAAAAPPDRVRVRAQGGHARSADPATARPPRPLLARSPLVTPTDVDAVDRDERRVAQPEEVPGGRVARASPRSRAGAPRDRREPPAQARAAAGDSRPPARRSAWPMAGGGVGAAALRGPLPAPPGSRLAFGAVTPASPGRARPGPAGRGRAELRGAGPCRRS